MQNITSTLTGLTSSLLLNFGLTKLAEKLDLIGSSHGQVIEFSDAKVCSLCSICHFSARQQR